MISFVFIVLVHVIVLALHQPLHAFIITHQHSNHKYYHHNQQQQRRNQFYTISSQVDNNMELTINGDTTATTTTTTSFSSSLSSEIIRQQSIQQYEQAMEYFMFELGNDIVFLSNNNDVSTYMNHNFDTIIFDCDGVLYRGGNVPIPECKDAIKYLMLEQKKHILFLTNNGEYSREGLCDKLMLILNGEEDDEDDEKEKEEGINSEKLELSQEQMVTSSYSTAKYLQHTLCQNNNNQHEYNIFVVGSQGLCTEIENFGFNVNSLSSSTMNSITSSTTTTSLSSMDRTALASYTFEEEETFNGKQNSKIDAIVVGLDTDFTYRKLCIVTALIQRHPNALFIATNEDSFDVVDGKSNNNTNNKCSSSSDSDNLRRNLPGNGSIVKAIEVSSEKKAINVGKPSRILVDILQKEYQLDVKRTLMVGDRLDTDVKFGKDSGMKSALVLTGCTTAEKLMEVGVGTEDEPLPHIIFPHIGMMAGN